MKKLLKIANKIDRKNSKIADKIEKIAMRPFYPEDDVKDWDAYRDLLEITGERSPIQFYAPPSGDADGKATAIIPNYSRYKDAAGEAFYSDSIGYDYSSVLLRALKGDEKFPLAVSNRPFGETMRHEHAHLDDLFKDNIDEKENYYRIRNSYEELVRPDIDRTTKLSLHFIAPEEIRARIVSAINYFKEKGNLSKYNIKNMPKILRKMFGWDNVMISTIMPMISSGGLDFFTNMTKDTFNKIVSLYQINKLESLWDDLSLLEKDFFMRGGIRDEQNDRFIKLTEKLDDEEKRARLMTQVEIPDRGDDTWEYFTNALKEGKIILEDESLENYNNFVKFINNYMNKEVVAERIKILLNNFNFLREYYSERSDNFDFYSDEVKDLIEQYKPYGSAEESFKRMLKRRANALNISEEKYLLFMRSRLIDVLDILGSDANMFIQTIPDFVVEGNDMGYSIDEIARKIAKQLIFFIKEKIPFKIIKGQKYIDALMLNKIGKNEFAYLSWFH